jgi:hypothetical protein
MRKEKIIISKKLEEIKFKQKAPQSQKESCQQNLKVYFECQYVNIATQPKVKAAALWITA